MTCVIAMREPGSAVIHMAADRAISGNNLVSLGGKKLVKFPSGLLVGFAGLLATQNIMVTRTELAGVDLADPLSIRLLFEGFRVVAAYALPSAPAQTAGAEMLLAMRGTLVYMGNLAGWYRVPEDVKVIGDGGLVALGSWHASSALPPSERLKRAIEAAAFFMPAIVSKESDYDQTP